MSAKRKTSPIWQFYSEELGTPFATCKICQSKLNRGKDGIRNTWSTSPLWKHLESKHRPEFKVASDEQDREKETTKRRKLNEEKQGEIYVNGTPKLQSFMEKKTKYNADYPEQQKLTK